MPKIQIENFDKVVENYMKKDPQSPISNNPLLWKRNFRLLICGASDSGKTNLLLQLLIGELLHYDRLFVFSKTLDQDKYVFLQQFFQDLFEQTKIELHKKLKSTKSGKFGFTSVDIESLEPTARFFCNTDEMPNIDEIDSSTKSLFVFDDCMVGAQKRFIEIFSLGRNRNISAIYISQYFYQCPLLVRQNCSHFAMFGQPSKRQIQLLYRDLPIDIPIEKFLQFYQTAITEKYNFFYIDAQNRDPKLRFRKNFGEFLE